MFNRRKLLLIVFAVLTPFESAFTWPLPDQYRSTQCGAMLSFISNDSTITPAVLDEETRRAAAFFRDFRMAAWPGLQGVHGSALRVRASDSRWARFSRKVPHRVRGMEIDAFGQRPPAADGGPPPVVRRAGTILKGRKNIETFLAMMDVASALAAQTVPTLEYPFSVGTFQNITAAAYTSMVVAPNLDAPGTAGAIFWSVLGGLGIANRIAGSIRHLDLGYSRHRRHIAQFLEGKSSSDWLFDSDTYGIERDEVTKFRRLDQNQFWERDSVTVEAFAKGMRNLTVRSWILVSPALSAITLGLDAPMTWVSWDRLVTRDPADGELTLALFLRYSDERPVYAPAPATSSERVPALSLQPMQITSP